MKSYSFYFYKHFVVYLSDLTIENKQITCYSSHSGEIRDVQIYPHLLLAETKEFTFIETVPHINEKRFLKYIQTHYPEYLV